MTGKEKCEYLKHLREQIAKDSRIEGFEFRGCDNQGECKGYCPYCDAEVERLTELLKEKGLYKKGNIEKILKETKIASNLQDDSNYSVCVEGIEEHDDLSGHNLENLIESLEDNPNYDIVDIYSYSDVKSISKFVTEEKGTACFFDEKFPFIMGQIDDNFISDYIRKKSLKQRDETVKSRGGIPQFGLGHKNKRIAEPKGICNIFGLSRLRPDGIDGDGITSLVGLSDCTLNCKYCINKGHTESMWLSCRDLYELLKKDSLYYDYTGGGICFGGHEPLLQMGFIMTFIEYVREKGETWKFGVETSLNVHSISPEFIDLLDYIIVDIKDLNKETYKKYTGGSPKYVYQNLRILSDVIKDRKVKVTIRVPIIKGYNSENEEYVNRELSTLINRFGFTSDMLEVVEYVTPDMYKPEESEESILMGYIADD